MNNRAALPGIATTSDHLVLRDAESSAPNVDVPAFAAINRMFYLALTPEDEVIIINQRHVSILACFIFTKSQKQRETNQWKQTNAYVNVIYIHITYIYM